MGEVSEGTVLNHINGTELQMDGGKIEMNIYELQKAKGECMEQFLENVDLAEISIKRINHMIFIF